MNAVFYTKNTTFSLHPFNCANDDLSLVFHNQAPDSCNRASERQFLTQKYNFKCKNKGDLLTSIPRGKAADFALALAMDLLSICLQP
jgi:hypothetical protein